MTDINVLDSYTSLVPLYARIAAEIESKIRSAEYPADSYLPSEKRLCEIHQASRSPVRQALQLLAQKRLIAQQKGKGVRVLRPRNWQQDMGHLRSLTESLSAQNTNPGCTLRRVERVAATDDVAAALEIEKGTPVLMVDRLRTVEDDGTRRAAVSLQQSYLAPSLPIDLEDVCTLGRQEASLYRLLAAFGIVFEYADDIITARLPDENEQKALGIDRGIPVLSLTRVAFYHDHPAEYALSCIRSDMSSYCIRVNR